MVIKESGQPIQLTGINIITFINIFTMIATITTNAIFTTSTIFISNINPRKYFSQYLANTDIVDTNNDKDMSFANNGILVLELVKYMS